MNGNSTGINLDLHQIIDLSEEGMAFLSAGPMEVGETLNFSVDLSDPRTYFHTSGRVAWSDPAGRTGVKFQKTAPEDAVKLREWLVANQGEAACDAPARPPEPAKIETPARPPSIPQNASSDKTPQPKAPPPPLHSDVSGLFAIEGLRLEIESVAIDLDSALQIVVQRALSLTRATGAAIALANGDEMVCRATSGPDAPPVGSRLQVGSGFSGECIRTGQLLHCDDSELDDRVDRESCRALDIRSIMAAPVRNREAVIGLIEIFSPDAAAFGQSDKTILQGMADLVQGTVQRASQAVGNPAPSLPATASAAVDAGPFSSTSHRDTEALVRSLAEAHTRLAMPIEEETSPPRRRFRNPWIYIAAIVAAILFSVWVILSSISARPSNSQPVVRSQTGRTADLNRQASLQRNSLQDLVRLAGQGDTLAGFTLGLRYATGSDAPQDYREAVRWFSFAADRGHVMAQSTLGAYYWAGRGVPQDIRKAYFWALLAQSAGDDASRARLPFLVSRLGRQDIIDVQRQADGWMKQHQAQTRIAAARN